jgi:dienelactone hydrolase
MEAKRARRGGGADISGDCGDDTRNRRKRFASSAAAAAIVLAIVIAATAPADAADVCGPFGDPPAKITGTVTPRCWGGVMMDPWKDSDGTIRRACVFDSAPESHGKRPLLIYLHPSLFGIVTIRLSNLLDHRNGAALGGDSTDRGFIVLAPIGRRTEHHYPFPDNSGIGWDNWYRQFSSDGDVTIAGKTYPENADAATIDHFLRAEIATGRVDPARIYVTGWSNGAAMAVLYALNRPAISAIAVYSAPDPFGAFDDPCPQTPVGSAAADSRQIKVSNPHLAIMHVHNSCDAAGLCPNAERLASQARRLGADIKDVMLTSLGNDAGACTDACGTLSDGDPNLFSNPLGWTMGLWNHLIWPRRRTSVMVDFLGHRSMQPLASAAQ